MTLATGVRFGPYEIQTALGAGGMGEVYRAQDTRLDRTVAIKVLPRDGADSPARRERLALEARAISRLSHPHICALHDVGEENGAQFLVMEYLEGDTLARRLTRGPLPLKDALRYAVEIADALAHAHRVGIVHRDLKPANIMLTRSGAKLLDFGIARALRPSEDSRAVRCDAESAGKWTTETLTEDDTILGTLEYMAPEQLEASKTDARTDLFAFGAVLYEMVSGRRAFPGTGKASIIAAILDHDPAPLAMPRHPGSAVGGDAVLPLLDHVITRCLAKDPDERWQTAADLKRELEWIATRGSAAATSSVDVPAAAMTGRGGRERLAWSVAGVLLVAFISTLGWGTSLYLRRATRDEPAYRTSIVLPSDVSLRGTAAGRFALSPDGRRLAFTALGEDAEPRLWVRSLDAISVRPLAGTEGGTAPFWSPDGRFLAFFAQDKLRKIDVEGGPPVTLADAQGGLGGSWSKDDVIVFASYRSGLRTVPASGGTPSPVSWLDAGHGEAHHAWPSVLPDGRHFLYHAAGSRKGGSFDPNGIYAGTLGSSERKLLVAAGSNAQYAAGHLLFMRQGTLMAQRFDSERLELTADPVSLGEQLVTDSFMHAGAFTVSATGALAYQGTASEAPSQLLWFDRTGVRLGTLGEPAYYRHPELSPDGTRVAVAVLDPAIGTHDLWVIDVARGVRTRFTFNETDERFPTWSPDGSRISFTSGREGTFDVFAQVSTGTSRDQRLVHDALNKYPTSWSPDGRFILYYTGTSTPGTGNDLWVLPLFGDRKPFQFLQTPFAETEGRFSPDGRWIAYQSRESGQTEVYVAAFPAAGRKWRVSTNGGNSPRWGRDGREILYLAPDNKLVAAAVKTAASTLEVGPPTPLFQTRPAHPSWTVSTDGRKVLINTIVEEATAAPITLFLNWTAGLSRSTS